MKTIIAAALTVLLFGCASADSSPSPKVTLTQVSVVEPIRAAMQTGVPVDYRLEITNPTQQPVTLTQVEIETIGNAGGYLLKHVRHPFNQSIAAGGTATIDFRAWVTPLQETQFGRIITPVNIRGVAKFDSMEKTIRTAFSARLEQSKD